MLWFTSAGAEAGSRRGRLRRLRSRRRRCRYAEPTTVGADSCSIGRTRHGAFCASPAIPSSGCRVWAIAHILATGEVADLLLFASYRRARLGRVRSCSTQKARQHGERWRASRRPPQHSVRGAAPRAASSFPLRDWSLAARARDRYLRRVLAVPRASVRRHRLYLPGDRVSERIERWQTVWESCEPRADRRALLRDAEHTSRLVPQLYAELGRDTLRGGAEIREYVSRGLLWFVTCGSR